MFFIINDRTVTTFLAADNRNGEMEIRQGLQIIDETAVKQPGDSEDRGEVLDEEEVTVVVPALVNR